MERAASTHVFQYAAHGGASAQALRKMPEPARILIVERELDQISKLKKTLFGSAYEAFTVFNQNQATLAISNWSPHLIISSLDLDWKTGWEFLSAARGLYNVANPDHRHVQSDERRNDSESLEQSARMDF